MKRRQLVELEDLPWFPATIRDAGTDFLRTITELTHPYAPVVPRLRQALEASGGGRVVDLCSGAGGPWLRLHAELGADAPAAVCLTDKFPNLAALERARASSAGRLVFAPQPVDATRVPDTLPGFRTLFAGFHHFPPERAREILADAVRQRQGIGVFEATHRSPAGVLAVLISPLLVLAVTPLIRPFRWSRLLFTYLVPVIPLFVLWDGVVSSLRTYTPAELRDLAESLGAADYQWETGEERARGAPIPVTYLIGRPLDG